ncbi:ABC transporter permease subunit [Clostridium beijerinckii]|uniref:ABC transporter permease subunit n=1 Tax=Clostridium beijerinckii TaxID=1520 RepID=UPI00156E2F5A|nr:ABC transporter permease subunit [Clostridium beijerinckii]NRT35995.1 taurine transport system permease protein [Clostridium beijerinckii]NRT44578.1 taurine transport system permease protein [Clostridium beijerinckii]NRT72636.1 taurine transport system permease protein [Clostridium beijerinckii]NRZ21430.1 taurine transport system permease protein [Clostridium beijerinckii]
MNNQDTATKIVKRKRGEIFYIGISFTSVVIFFIVWEIATSKGLINQVFLPSPQKVWQAFIELVQQGYKGESLLSHIAISMERLFIAIFFAIIIGVPLGLIAGSSRIVRAIIDPFIEFYRPLPPLAYYTLIVLWFGIGDESKIILLFLNAFAPLLIGVIFSVQKVPLDRINGAKSLGASGINLFISVIFRSCLPDILTSLRTAIGVAYATLVAAEMVAAVSGIGWMVLDASKYLRNDIVYAGVIIMGIIAIILDSFVRFLIRKASPWLEK